MSADFVRSQLRRSNGDQRGCSPRHRRIRYFSLAILPRLPHLRTPTCVPDATLPNGQVPRHYGLLLGCSRSLHIGLQLLRVAGGRKIPPWHVRIRNQPIVDSHHFYVVQKTRTAEKSRILVYRSRLRDNSRIFDVIWISALPQQSIQFLANYVSGGRTGHRRRRTPGHCLHA